MSRILILLIIYMDQSQKNSTTTAKDGASLSPSSPSKRKVSASGNEARGSDGPGDGHAGPDVKKAESLPFHSYPYFGL
ncbi:hypothetical protein BV898_12303 [Hypsibius exemplaris]|uniref:Uncharacterized protein n=1 Tax=Hypsibius exemplaris TaxID=2072580 RepID=A0A1W0WE12_HYPEX|nr:hypothetical protein BV898_12303 [Hypsibius exemplaris]